MVTMQAAQELRHKPDKPWSRVGGDGMQGIRKKGNLSFLLFF